MIPFCSKRGDFLEVYMLRAGRPLSCIWTVLTICLIFWFGAPGFGQNIQSDKHVYAIHNSSFEKLAELAKEKYARFGPYYEKGSTEEFLHRYGKGTQEIGTTSNVGVSVSKNDPSWAVIIPVGILLLFGLVYLSFHFQELESERIAKIYEEHGPTEGAKILLMEKQVEAANRLADAQRRQAYELAELRRIEEARESRRRLGL